MGGPPQVKNRAPAPIQITAEQLLREAKDRKLEDINKAPKQFITDKEELVEYQRTKRQDFENQIRRQRNLIGIWCKYGLWEASQKEYENARSVFERALDVDYRNQTIWFKYIEMELKAKFINHARNILDRCVALHPRVDKFWFKYSYVEEMLGEVEGARQVFERWMKWEPDDLGWAAYIKFEMRQGEVSRARGLYERYCSNLPTSRAYLKYAKWEESLGEKQRSRVVYERSMEEIHPDEDSGKLLINFARFEERCKEFDRCRVIYKYAMDHTASEESQQEINQELIGFEKRHGDRKGIDDAIVQNRRKYYEELVTNDRFDYDSWFDYIWLEEKEGDTEKVREMYERAISNVPPIPEKRFWKRYIYLWINYAIFEEVDVSDVSRARDIYKRCLKIIPHQSFTFGKIWLYAAQLEVRQKDLTAARKLLGQAIGMCPKENLFNKYVELELQLGEVDRCRSIYAKYLETMPHNCTAWKAFAQLEVSVGESARARAIYDIAIRQPELDMPEMLWKEFIDFETTEGETQHVRNLYTRLLERTSHVKVWISFGKFETSEALQSVGTESVSTTDTMRDVFRRGYALLKSQGLKEERLLLLQAWRECEADAMKGGLNGDTLTIDTMMPKKVKMRRMATGEGADGVAVDLGWEEYYDYVFPDDEKKIGSLKILEKALLWKQQAAAVALENSTEDGGINTSTDSSGESDSLTILGKRNLEELQKDNAAIDIDDI